MKFISKITIIALLLAISVFLFSSLAMATAKINAIEVVENLVKIDATEPMKFTIDNRDPFNIVIDLINTEFAIPQDKPYTGKGLISEIKAEKFENNKTRLNITVISPSDVEATLKDKSLFISFTKNHSVTKNSADTKQQDIQKTIISETAVSQKSSDKTLQPAKEIIAVILEKTDLGAEIIIKGNGAMPEPVVYKLDDSLIIELERMVMNAYMPKTMIEPIKALSYTSKDNLIKIKVDIEPDGSSPYLKKDKEFSKDVTVVDDEIVISVETKPFVESQKVGYSKDIIDLDYSNADVKNVIQSIAIRVGYGWIIDENVTATVTIKQNAIHWKEALKLLEKIADVQIFVDDKTQTVKVQKSEFTKLGVQKEGDLISFDFQDADLSSVIMLLSEVSGFNIIIHPDIKDVKYKVNTKLKNVTWQKSLDKIVKLLSLEYTVDDEDKIITIAPLETINKIEEARQKIRDSRAKVYESWSKLYTERSKIATEKLKALMSEQKITKIIKLKYISTFNAIKHITQLNIFRGVRSEVKTQQAGSVRQETVDTKISEAAIEAEVGITRIDTINAIVIRHVPTIVEEVERFIKAIDIPSQATQQVLIEARIVEVSTTSAYDLGVQWGVSGWGATKDGGILSFGGSRDARPTQSSSDYATTPYAQTGIGQATQGTMGSTNLMPLIINMPAAVGQGAGGSFGIGYINKAASLMLDFRLSALEKAGKGKILSQPKIMTLNNSPSLIRHGARVPITTPGSTQGTYTTTYIDAALLMKVTPSIVFGTSENIIYIDLEISKDEPATSSDRKDILGNPQIDSRAATTRIALKDGETVVIGGIRKEVSSEGESSVPYLSKIPILGSLFKKEDKTNVSEELMIFLTPKIVQPIKQD
ncbi:MAG: AMIN domain-containing protein [Thermodesulfovibrionales bacterium]|nr:AMIN domain-containing protein [Thermodesulfovibrionales bacterium]